MPGSIVPQRVPIISPSSGVKPMCIDALAVTHRTEARAAAEMGNDVRLPTRSGEISLVFPQ